MDYRHTRQEVASVRQSQQTTFGRLLRQLREDAGLTQQALAERCGLSVQAISTLERGTRTRPQLHTVQALCRGLNLDEAMRADLQQSLRYASLPRQPAAPVEPVQIPGNEVIGRDFEVRELAVLAKRANLCMVTLVGPAGIGKTRLGMQVAEEIARRHGSRIVSLALADVTSPTDVLPLVATAIQGSPCGDRDPLAVIHEVQEREFLVLVLDTFEHLMDAAVDMTDLLHFCPSMTVIATSQSPLCLQGEQVYPVRPLPVPSEDADLSDPMLVNDYPALALFRARARAVSPHFEIDAENLADVIAICWELDGIPLAIELAAARVRTLPVAAIRAELERDRFALLSDGARDLPERHQSLIDAFTWSLSQCSDAEQRLFCAIAMAPDGLTVAELAAHTGQEMSELLPLLHGLVDSSLLTVAVDVDGRAIYGMLKTIRAFARSERVLIPV